MTFFCIIYADLESYSTEINNSHGFEPGLSCTMEKHVKMPSGVGYIAQKMARVLGVKQVTVTPKN